MNAYKIFGISILHYYCIFMQLYSLYKIFSSVVGRTSFTRLPSDVAGITDDIYSELVNGISVSNLSEVKHPNKFYWIVIDALRPDFINEEDTPFIWSSLQSTNSDLAAKAFTVKVHSPTVTLPRIKSLLTGTIPSYQDFITNFHSTRLEDDNLIWKFKKSGKNTCFYGDDTWLKLFDGNAYFARYEGVHSFFVTDWIEVDENVTRNLYRELTHELEPECQITVLHFLGLDHIGHVHGPKSSFINEKLREMDKIVERIFHSVEESSLLFICGDHGMANIGGHGGDSWEEVHTILIALGKGEAETDTVFGNSENLIYQTDIAPTIAAIFGLDTPEPSIGTLIPDILSIYSSPVNILQAYIKNFVHLMSIMDRSGQTIECKNYLNELRDVTISNDTGIAYLTNLISKYIQVNQKMSHTLGEKLSGERDLFQMTLSIVILAQIVAIMATNDEEFYSTLVESSTNFMASFKLIVVPILSFVFISLDLSLIITNSVILYYFCHFNWRNIFRYKLNIFPALTIYFASSLIEEEHYVRYFLWTSIIFYTFMIANPVEQGQNNSSQLLNVMFLLLIHRVTSVLNQTGQKWTETKDLNDVISEYQCVELVSFSCIIVLLWLKRNSSMLFRLSICYIYVLKLFLYWNENTSSKYVLCVQIGYVLIGMTLVWDYYKSHNQVLLNTVIQCCLLLHKIINFPIIVSVLLQLKLLRIILEPYCKTDKSADEKPKKIPASLISLYIWLAYACFFYQGNSNNITTIEVNIGFTGIDSYNSLIIGSIIFFYTSSSPFIVYSSILSDDYIQPSLKSQITHALVNINALECFVYSVVIFMFQNHLFVWSVFVPKLLYLAGWTVFHIVILTLTSLRFV